MKNHPLRKILLVSFSFLAFALAEANFQQVRAESASSQVSTSTDNFNLPVRACDYADFLNHVATSDPKFFYDEKMRSDSETACILRFGKPGNFHYEVMAGREGELISFVNKNDEDAYCKWNETKLQNTSSLNTTSDVLESDRSLKSNKNHFGIELSSSPQLSLITHSVGDHFSQSEVSVLIVACFAAVCMTSGDRENPSTAENSELPLGIDQAIRESEGVVLPSTTENRVIAVQQEQDAHYLEISHLLESVCQEAIQEEKIAKDLKNVALAADINNRISFEEAWDMAEIKNEKVRSSWSDLVEFYDHARELIPLEKKSEWNDKQEDARYKERQAFVMTQWLSALKSEKIADGARAKALLMNPTDQEDFEDAWSHALEAVHVTERACSKILETYTQEKENIPQSKKAEWERDLYKSQFNQSYYLLRPLWIEAEKESRVGIAARDKAKLLQHCEESEESWHDAEKKAQAAHTAWKEVEDASDHAIDSIPNHLESAWKAEIAKATYEKEKSFLLCLEIAFHKACYFVKAVKEDTVRSAKDIDIHSINLIIRNAADRVVDAYKNTLIPKEKESEWAAAFNKFKEELEAAKRHQLLPIGALTNNKADCFINSTLQFCKAFKYQLNLEVVKTMPYLLRFFTDQLFSDHDCRLLRQEMASHLLLEESDFRNVVVDGVAQSHQDAAAFLRLLLEKTEAPKVTFQETLINQNSGEQRTREVSESKAIIELQFPEVKDGHSLTMQEVIDHNLTSSMDGYYWKENDPTTATTIIKKSELSEPFPSSLIITLGRFQFVNGIPVKREDPILGFDQEIFLPSSDGKSVAYLPKAIICHVGDTPQAGHYVCYRVKDGYWERYDDDKAVGTLGSIEDALYVKKNAYVISYVQKEVLTEQEIEQLVKKTSDKTKDSQRSELDIAEQKDSNDETANDHFLAMRLHACEVFEERYHENITAIKKAKEAFDNLAKVYDGLTEAQKALLDDDPHAKSVHYQQALWNARSLTLEAQKAEEIAAFTKSICATINPKDCENVRQEAIAVATKAKDAWDDVINRVAEAITKHASMMPPTQQTISSHLQKREVSWEEALDDAFQQKEKCELQLVRLTEGE